jgi:hypothetical protein
VNYFKGVDAREKYDNFFEKVLKVKDVVVLTFADLVQRLLVDYIRDVLLQPEAAEWFSTWWTGARGRYCLAHAGYGGSNNNMGVEVDWRDAKGLGYQIDSVGGEEDSDPSPVVPQIGVSFRLRVSASGAASGQSVRTRLC